MVKPGDTINAGLVIALLGRTGANAYKKRSPTHLHISCLQIENELPVTQNIYDQLVNATKY
jgi:murein DD-endopeptidase MepM/ murein hydrolase activator NlpD